MYHNSSINFQETQFDSSEQVYELVSEEDRKKYVCKQPGCGKIFRYKSEIVRHAATHSESRPFICQYDNCFKAFKRNDALENHIRSSHTKETPFVCPLPECGMKFTTHGSFRYHVLKHNKQNPELETPMHQVDAFEEEAQPKKHVKLNSPSTSTSSDPNQMSLKIDPIYKKMDMDGLGEEYMVPPPRFAGEIKWEMVNDDDENETQQQQQPQDDSVNQINQLNQVLEENQVLKQKLNTSEKVIKSMQKQINDLLGSLFAYQSQFTSPPEELQLNRMPSLSMATGPSFEPLFQNLKEEPMIDMINYNDNKEMILPVNMDNFPLNQDNNSFDTFFSFNREVSAFDF